MIRGKRGISSEVTADIIGLIITALALSFMFWQAASFATDSFIEKRVLSRDISLLLNTIYASPEKLIYGYPGSDKPMPEKLIKSIGKQEGQKVYVKESNDDAGNFYWFASDENIASSGFLGSAKFLKLTKDYSSLAIEAAEGPGAIGPPTGMGRCGEKVVQAASYYIGTPYDPYPERMSCDEDSIAKGTEPAFLSCACFVSLSYIKAYYVEYGKDTGLFSFTQSVPDLRKQMVDRGYPKIEYAKLMPGDIIIFDMPREGPYNHAGIAIGNGKFIDSGGGASEETLVVTERNLEDNPWKKSFLEAYRPCANVEIGITVITTSVDSIVKGGIMQYDFATLATTDVDKTAWVPCSDGESYHQGIDIVTKGTNGEFVEGAEIFALESGTVIGTHSNEIECYTSGNSMGNYVLIQADNRNIYRYMHMQKNSIPSNVLYQGDSAIVRVTAGQKIGAIGKTGTIGTQEQCDHFPHLHMDRNINDGIRNCDSFVDPFTGKTLSQAVAEQP